VLLADADQDQLRCCVGRAGIGATVFVAERAEGSAAGVLGACGCVAAATGEAESWPGAAVVTDLPPNTIVTAIVTTIRIGRV